MTDDPNQHGVQPGVYGGAHGQGEEFDTNKTKNVSQPTDPQRGPSNGRVDHTGRGPRGWQRTDDQIREEACHRLARDSHVDASQIEVTVEKGEITLAGTVEDRRQKRLAEACVEAVGGVVDVHNRLRVLHSG